MANPKKPDSDDPVAIPLDPDEALRALLKVDPDSEPAEAEQEAAARQEQEYPGDDTDEG